MMRLSITGLVGVVLLVLLACSSPDDDQASGEIRVVVSLEIFADMVRNVAGDHADVQALLPSGADTHTYELPPNRVARVARADITFINGLGLEEASEDVIRNSTSGPVIELADGLPVLDAGDEDDQSGGNPHLWLNVQLAARYVETIRDALIELDPVGRADYQSNAKAYLDELAVLDEEFVVAVEAIPAENRKLVTFHDAYPYMAERYGLEVTAVVVPSPGQEPSAQAIADLVRDIEGLPAVFKEPQFNAEVLELAAEDAGVQVLDLLSDAYVDGVDSYVDLMRFNMNHLLEGLGGE
ncbi:MAG: zinc ABC transporter substrate-binding protein [Chloroflexi bacterium]|nr:zinc ABC transporter substrate-binding protein [Chloroflexota bacterium]